MINCDYVVINEKQNNTFSQQKQVTGCSQTHVCVLVCYFATILLVILIRVQNC